MTQGIYEPATIVQISVAISYKNVCHVTKKGYYQGDLQVTLVFDFKKMDECC